MSTENKVKPLDQLLMRLARIEAVFGSDVYVSYTHAYVWQANQICHVFFGLFFGLLLLWSFCGSPTGVLIGLGIYVAKELVDYLIAVRLSEGVFPVNKIEVARDCIVDVLFVAGGVFVAVSMEPSAVRLYCGEPSLTITQWVALLSFASVLGIFLLMRKLFLGPKRAFDKSGMSWLVRLSTVPSNFSRTELPALREEIPGFARGNGSFRHLVVSGPPQSGRTTFAQSIGGDATAAQRRVRSLTAQRLLEKKRIGFETPSARAQPYQVAEAELVIVDGLDASSVRGHARSLPEMDEMLGRLVDVGDTTIFQVPLREPAHDSGEPRSLGDKPRKLPQIVWVIDDMSAAEPLRSAIARKFEGKAKLVLLQDRLQRRMRLEE